MSFTLDIVNELTEREPEKACCKKAFLFGLFFGAEKVSKIEVRTELKTEQSADLASSILKKQFSAEPSIEPIVRTGRRFYTVSARSKAIATYLENIDQKENIGTEEFEKILGCVKNCDCEKHFLAGVFVSSGIATDPEKRYSLEFGVKNEVRALWLSAFLAKRSGAPSYVEHPSRLGLCYRGNEAICDVLACMGANNAYGVAIDVFVRHDIKNRENRATNCVTKNIQKTVDAARVHIQAIELLKASGRFSRLSEDLKYTANLRCEYDSVSLSELAALHEPHISKSGLNRRLEKILAIANEEDN